jgi:hypothetical protein
MYTRWTVEMERMILHHLIGMKEQVERGAKKADLSLSIPMFKVELQRQFGVSFHKDEIEIRIDLMMGRLDYINYVLSQPGVYRDNRRGLICIDTTMTPVSGDEISPQRYHLYDISPLFSLVENAFT